MNSPLTLFTWGFIIYLIIHIIILSFNLHLIKYIKHHIILSIASFVCFALFLNSVYSNDDYGSNKDQLMFYSGILAMILLVLILTLVKVLIAKIADEKDKQQADS